MRSIPPELALERILIALERDVMEVTDEELLMAARELGMNPAMKGSAAFFGVTRLLRPPSWPREQINSWLAALSPKEAKALRARFGLDKPGRTVDEAEVILRALARDLAALRRKQ
jgi:hypothetical protein